ncbi:MAG: WD40/YVTN/BNR-like repeat-containing protein [Candidatus Kapaibacterium sp.]
MHKAKLLLLLIIIPSIGYAQSDSEISIHKIFGSKEDKYMPYHVQFAPNRNIFLNFGKLFRSTNNGVTWKKIFDSDSNDLGPLQISNVTGSLFRERLNRQYHVGLFRSTDNGDHWSVIYDDQNLNGYLALDGRGVIFITLSEKKNAILMSADDGLTWTTLQGTPSFYKDPKWKRDATTGASDGSIFSDVNGTIFFSGPPDKEGLYYTSNFGKKWSMSKFWKRLKKKGEEKSISAFTVDSVGNIYCGINVQRDKTHERELTQNTHPWVITQGFYIICSRDKGKTWEYISSLIDGGNEGTGWGMAMEKLEFDHNGNMYVITASGIFRSTDNGKSFHHIKIDGETYALTYAKDTKGNIYGCPTNGKGFIKISE